MGLATARRKYPRVGLERPCDVELRMPQGRGPTRRVRVPMTIRSLSCEGAGLALQEPLPAPLDRGAGVVLHFSAGDQAVILPGHVVWYSPEPGRALEVGVRLQLELAEARSRQAYATWIVDVTRREALGRRR
jgi:hypothetical protein